MQHYAVFPSTRPALKSFETGRDLAPNATEPTFCCELTRAFYDPARMHCVARAAECTGQGKPIGKAGRDLDTSRIAALHF